MRFLYLLLVFSSLSACEKSALFEASNDFARDAEIIDFLTTVSHLTDRETADIELIQALFVTADRIEKKYSLNENRALVEYLEVEIATILEQSSLNSTQRQIRSFATVDTFLFEKEEIWTVLTNTENYSNWNPFTIGVETTFEVGSPIIMDVRLLPFLTIEQAETIAVFDPFDDMCWSSFIISESIFSTFRCRSLVGVGNNATIYSNTMVYDGLIAPLVNAITRPLVFHGFVQESKALSNYLENK